MDPILNNNEYTEVEGRYYANPQISLDRSMNFIDNLRATQAQQNQQIAKDTAALGTEVSSNLGGLGTNTPAGLSYFTSRYEVPQTASAVANLRAAAQAAALNQALENEQAIWKKRYQQAYRNYQKRAYDASKTPQTPSTTTGDVEEYANELTGQGRLVLDDQDFAEGGVYLVEPASGNIIGEGFSGNNPRYILQKDGSYSRYGSSSRAWAAPSVDLIDILTDFQYNGKRKTSTQNKSSNGFSGR